MIWLVLLVAFLVVEALTVSLVSLWFAAGALVALVAAMVGAAIWLQILLFFAVSAVLLACLRPLKQRLLKKPIATNVDSVVGSRGYVTAAVCNETSTGRVKLGGMEWSARSADGAPIPEGTLVQVARVEGVKVFVSPVNAELTSV